MIMIKLSLDFSLLLSFFFFSCELFETFNGLCVYIRSIKLLSSAYILKL